MKAPGDVVSRALIDAEFERVVASEAFRHSARHVRFLRFLLEHTLSGETAKLREMALGVEVFYRNERKFDPRVDTIVRVEARRLRQRLARYYADEGADARLEFSLPVGGYALSIVRRDPGDAAARRMSVAVLPFVHENASGDEQPFVAGLGYALTAALTRLNGLRVVAGGSAAALAEVDDTRRIGRELAVANLVRGVVTRSPDARVTMSVQLVRTSDAAVIWSRGAQCERAQALEHIETLARAIIQALHRVAGEQRLARIVRAGPLPAARELPGIEARDLIDRAHWCLRERTLDAYRKAVELFEAATALAPSYAPAYAGLARALVHVIGMTALPSHPNMDAARQAALRAIALDPESADAHGQLGLIHLVFDHDWAAAEAACLRALRHGPAMAEVHARYAWALMFNRRFAEADIAFREARELDPLDLTYRAHHALLSLYQRRYAEADAALERVLEVSPEHLIASVLRAALRLYDGRTTEGQALFREIARRHPKLSIGRCGLAQAWAMAGDDEQARRELAWLIETFDAGYVSPYQIAMVYARLEEHDHALDWLERAAALRDFNFVCAGVDPTFDALRDDARFALLLTRHGFGHIAAPLS